MSTPNIDPRWADIDFDKVNAELRDLRDQVVRLQAHIDRTQPVQANAEGYVQPDVHGEPDREKERAAFEADAEPLGFELLRTANPNVEPWDDYLEMDTGMRWGGWLARAAHAQATEPAWRPIESAPKDGTHILAVLPDSDTCYVICWSDPKAGIRSELSETDEIGWRVAFDGFLFASHEQPTHWMPLPEGPEATNG